MEKLFLLDAYALIFRAYYAMIKAPRMNSKGFNTSAILGFVNTLQEILAKEKPTHIGVAFDPKGGSFRQRIFEAYKAQREETPETIRQSVPYIKQIIEAYNIPILEVPDFEADDVIGTLSKQADERGIETYMLTPDKDYCQLVTDNVSIFRPRHGGGYEVMNTSVVLEKYGIRDTDQIRDLLGLMGDSADNIPGCPGVGEKTAAKLIDEFGSVENILDNVGSLKGALKQKVSDNAELIRLSKMLATIRRDVPIELDMEKLKTTKPDIDKLRIVLGELEMKSLLARIVRDLGSDESTEDDRLSVSKEAKTAEPKNDGFYASFFEEFTDGNTNLPKNEILKGVKPAETELHLITNQNIISDFNADIKGAEHIGIYADITEGHPVFAEIIGFAFARSADKVWYLPNPKFSTNSDISKDLFSSTLRNLLEDGGIAKTGHNLKPLIQTLTRAGIGLNGKLFDTMIAHYVLQPEQKHELKFIAKALLGEEIETDEQENANSQGMLFFAPDPHELSSSAAVRVATALRLKPILEDGLKKDETEELFWNVEMPLVRVLAEMERNGARIDTASLRETSRNFTERLRQIEEEIYANVGFSFNILSPKQVGDVLFDRLKLMEKPKKTKKGTYVTSEEILEKLRDRSPVVEQILQYRGLRKLIGTYVDALPALISPETGKIHSQFNQTVTATGRLSSSNPNLQNIPVRDEDGKEVRKAFIPDDGCRFFSADYSQIELRIMAHLSGDRNMIEDFEKGEDIHAATAAKIFHKRVDEVTKAERAKAKTANFGIIYGISAFGLAERMKVSRTEAKELIENYFKTYPQISNYIGKQIEKAREKGYIETMMHRKRYLPDITSHNATVRGYAERNAVNAPIQGSAADIIKCAMVRIFDRFKQENLRSTMILQVHDELNFNVVRGEEEKVERIVTQEMQNAAALSVSLLADCGWGSNWLEAH